MLLNHHDTASTTNGATVPAAKVCGNCSSDAQRILHNVRHRGIFRRLCTSCVLRLHPHSFCPTCFAVYHSSQSPVVPNGAITCIKCYSASHSTCVGPNPQSRYICPLCANPSAPIFVLKKVNELNLSIPSSGVNGIVAYDENDKIIDKRAAKVLVAAAMISSLSMSEAELAAKAVAERRAKEAASTRKRATQALDYMAALAAREKMKKSESLPGSGMGVAISRFAGNVVNGLTEKMDGYGYSRGGNMKSDAVGGVRIEEKKQVAGILVDRSSNEVLTRALNSVDMRENERLGGVGPQGSSILELSSSNGVATDVGEQRGTSLGSGLEVRDLAVEDHDGVLNERSGEIQVEDALPEYVNNSMVLHPPKEDWMEGVEISNPGMQGVESYDPGKNKLGVAMYVDERRGISSGPGLEVRDPAVQDHDCQVLNERSGDPAIILDEDALLESFSVNNSVVLHLPKEDWMEGVESRMQGVESTNPGKHENDVPMGISSGSALEDRDSAVQNPGSGVLNERSGDSAKILDEDALRESVNNSVVSHPQKEDWMDRVESSNHRMQCVESTDPGNNENGVAMGISNSTVLDHDGGVLNETSGDSVKIQGGDGLLDSVNNSVISYPPKEDLMEGVESRNLGMQGVEDNDPGKEGYGMQQ